MITSVVSLHRLRTIETRKADLDDVTYLSTENERLNGLVDTMRGTVSTMYANILQLQDANVMLNHAKREQAVLLGECQEEQQVMRERMRVLEAEILVLRAKGGQL